MKKGQLQKGLTLHESEKIRQKEQRKALFNRRLALFKRTLRYIFFKPKPRKRSPQKGRFQHEVAQNPSCRRFSKPAVRRGFSLLLFLLGVVSGTGSSLAEIIIAALRPPTAEAGLLSENGQEPTLSLTQDAEVPTSEFPDAEAGLLSENGQEPTLSLPQDAEVPTSEFPDAVPGIIFLEKPEEAKEQDRPKIAETLQNIKGEEADKQAIDLSNLEIGESIPRIEASTVTELEAPYISESPLAREDLPNVAISSAEAQQNKAIIYDILRNEFGFSRAITRAILITIERESTFNPKVWGNNVFGLIQWGGDRIDNLLNYCKEEKLDPTTIRAQLLFLKHELETDYSKEISIPMDVTKQDYTETKNGVVPRSGAWTFIQAFEDNAQDVYPITLFFNSEIVRPRDKWETSHSRAAAAQQDFIQAYPENSYDVILDERHIPIALMQDNQIVTVAPVYQDFQWTPSPPQQHQITGNR